MGEGGVLEHPLELVNPPYELENPHEKENVNTMGAMLLVSDGSSRFP